MIALILGLAVTGLVVGALGRLIVPGPNPMGIGSTIVVGLGGSFLGGLIGRLGFGLHFYAAYGLGLVLSVLCAALIVVFISRRNPHSS